MQADRGTGSGTGTPLYMCTATRRLKMRCGRLGGGLAEAGLGWAGWAVLGEAGLGWAGRGWPFPAALPAAPHSFRKFPTP